MLLLERIPTNIRNVLEKAPIIADWLVDCRDELDPGEHFFVNIERLEETHDIFLSGSELAREILMHEIRQRSEIAKVNCTTASIRVRYTEPKMEIEPEMA